MMFESKQDYSLMSTFVPTVLTFLILVFLNFYAGVEVPSILYIIVSLIFSLTAHKDEILIFGICCIPMLNMFQSKYVLFICMIGYVIAARHSIIRLGPQCFPVAFLMVWEFCHAILDSSFSLSLYLRLFTELLFLAFVMNCDFEYFEFEKLFRSFAIVTIAISILILMLQLRMYSFNISAMIQAQTFRFGYKLDNDVLSASLNPNLIAYECLLATEGLGLLFYTKKSSRLDLILVSVLCVFGILTLSRKFLLCGLLYIVPYLFYSSDGKNKAKKWLTVIFAIALSIIVLHILFPTIIDSMLSRFSEDDITSGRTDLFLFYQSAIWNNPRILFFGVGMQNYAEKIYSTFNYYNIPHNGIQEIILMWGLPGLIAFGAVIIAMVMAAKGVNKHITVMNLLPLFVMLFYIQGAQMVSSSMINLMWSYVFLCMLYRTNLAT